MVMARSRSRRVMAWRAGCSFDGHEGGQGDEVARPRPDLEPGDVLGPRPLGGHELQADVDAAAPGAVLADADAADEGVQGRGDVVDRDADVRGHGPVGLDPELGHAELVVGVEVDDDAALAELRHDPLALIDELVPVRAADREFDREPALGGEALLGEVLDDGPEPGDGVELAAQDGRQLGLAELPLLAAGRG